MGNLVSSLQGNVGVLYTKTGKLCLNWRLACQEINIFSSFAYSLLEKKGKNPQFALYFLEHGLIFNIVLFNFCTHTASSCATNICQNGGSCYETSDSRFCVCSLGFLGTFCETRESKSHDMSHDTFSMSHNECYYLIGLKIVF